MEASTSGIRTCLRSCVLFVIAGALCVSSASAQRVDTSTFSGPRTCTSCTVQLTQITSLGAPTDSVLLFSSSLAVTDSRGFIYVNPVSSRGAVAVFDRSGKLVRTVGREGQGPGEAEGNLFLTIGANDTLYTLETSTRRVNVFGPNHNYVRSFQNEISTFEWMALASGGFAAVGAAAPPDTFRSPVHFLGDHGQVIASFGRTTPVIGRHPPSDLFSQVAVDTSGIWLNNRMNYHLSHWGSDGVLRKVIRVQSDNLEEADVSRIGLTFWLHRQEPHLRDLGISADGHLLALLRVPAPNWQPAPATPSMIRGEHQQVVVASPGLSEWDKYINHVLEVIHPRSGELLATTRLPASHMGFAGRGHVYSKHELENGIVVMRIWRVELVRSR